MLEIAATWRREQSSKVLEQFIEARQVVLSPLPVPQTIDQYAAFQ